MIIACGAVGLGWSRKISQRVADNHSFFRSWWNNLPPDWRAAIWIAPFNSILDIFCSFVPILGYILTLPISILLFYIQGILVGKYARSDSRYIGRSYARLGALSGLWTSVVIATILGLIIKAIETSLTFGAALALVPVDIAIKVIDITLNISIAALTAWLFSRLKGVKFIGASIGIAGCSLLVGLIVVILLVILAIYLGNQLYGQLPNIFGH